MNNNVSMKKIIASFCILASILIAPAVAQDALCDAGDSVKAQPYQIRAPITQRNKNLNRPLRKSSSAARASIYPLSVLSVSGDVQFERAGQTQLLGTGQYLYLNDIVSTGKNGFVSLRLGDGTVNALPPNARLRLLQVNAYTARYELLKGRIESKVTKSPNAKKSTFEIRLPTVSIGVRGTHFSVAYDPNQNTMKTEVREGLVKVQQRSTCSAPLMLSAGESVRLDITPWQVRPLLAAPALVDSNETQRDPSRLTFKVQPITGAQHYVAQVANDAAFLDIEREFSSNDTQLQLPDDNLKDGFYYVRLMAEDEQGLRGQARQYLFLRNRPD